MTEPHACPTCKGGKKKLEGECPTCHDRRVVWEPEEAAEEAADSHLDLTYRP